MRVKIDRSGTLSATLLILSINLFSFQETFGQIAHSGCANFFQQFEAMGKTVGNPQIPISSGKSNERVPPITSGGPPPITSGGPPPITSGGPPPITSGGPPPITSGGPPPITSGGPPPITSGGPPPITSGGPPPITSGGPPPITSGGPPPITSGGPPPITSGGPPPITSGGPPPINSGGPSKSNTADSFPFVTAGPPPIVSGGPPPLSSGGPFGPPGGLEGGTKSGGSGKFTLPPKAFAINSEVSLDISEIERRSLEPKTLELDVSKKSSKTSGFGNNRKDFFFTATKAVKFIASGSGICGAYNSDNQIGVCLYSGIDKTGQDPSKSGWLSGSAVQNCQAEVYLFKKIRMNSEIFRPSNPQLKITAKVVDGCELESNNFNSGCQNIFITKALFNALRPNRKENDQGHIDTLSWSFKKSPF
ncbi:hypothetical protein BY996DRAFT_6413032 [Phakopsora pachyrhizi]|nr:hypothetical protein BY996DRAFT_6413032 [Phakopsora pachyrhizi]